MDYWLINLWFRKGQPNIRYIPSYYLLPRANPESAESISVFRKRFDLPLNGPCPLEWVIGFTLIGGSISKGGNHYCLILFMPEEKQIHILGRGFEFQSRLKNPESWASWGSNIWKNVAALHQWDSRERMAVYEVNWIQNGYDCGATVCQIMEIIWTGGFLCTHGGFWRKPVLDCCHGLRKRMAGDIHQIVLTNLERFNQIRETRPTGVLEIYPDVDSWEEDVKKVQKILGPNPGVCLDKILKALTGSMGTCVLCRIADRPVRQITNPFAGLRRKARPKELEDDGEQSFFEEDMDENSGKSATMLNQPFHVTDREQSSIGRFPRLTPPPVLPPLGNLLGLCIPPDSGYDEYESGPTMEENEPIPDTITPFGEINLVYLANQVITNPWSTFRDHGYRIEPDFSQAFHLGPPTMVKEHIMPSKLKYEGGEEQVMTEISRRGEPIEISDLEIMGAKEIMSLPSDGVTNHSALLTGKTADGRLIKLDLERDSVTPIKIQKAVDIDSVIWVTRYPIFKHSIHIFCKPVIRNKPPIFKHNHIYVDLLVPQTEKDKHSLGYRKEWWAKTFKLFQIPHLQLGKMGDGSGSVNLLMAFPRMTHKHPYIPRWVNIIPSDVQNVLWDQVILPAMRKVMKKINHPYVGLARSDLSFKEKGRGVSKSTKTYPFRREEFIALAREMDDLVSILY
jgi:hypothetical protein